MDQTILTVVPPELKRLVRLVARAFYSPEQFLVLDILAKYPCVTEDDLFQLLHFESKKLRVILAFLKKDKLIKNIQRVESVESMKSGEKKNITVQYYYINYKVFVNVVKYKLYRIREKITNEEKKSRHRTMYTCTNCQSSYTELDVDRLLDHIDKSLKCIMCRSVLKENTPEGNLIDARTLLSNLNDQLQPILQLLKETENMNLAPEVLEPEPQGINKHVLEASRRHKGQQQQGTKLMDQWTARKADDIYGDQTVSINFGDGDEKEKQSKAAPDWMTKSTVYGGNTVITDNTVSTEINTTTTISDGEIMALLINEKKKPPNDATVPTSIATKHPADSSSSNDTSGGSSSDDEDDDTTSDDDAMDQQSSSVGRLHGGYPVNVKDDDDEEFDSSDSDDDQLSMKIGNKVYPISEIPPELVAQMNSKEKQRYTELYQQAYTNFYS